LKIPGRAPYEFNAVKVLINFKDCQAVAVTRTSVSKVNRQSRYVMYIRSKNVVTKDAFSYGCVHSMIEPHDLQVLTREETILFNFHTASCALLLLNIVGNLSLRPQDHTLALLDRHKATNRSKAKDLCHFSLERCLDGV